MLPLGRATCKNPSGKFAVGGGTSLNPGARKSSRDPLLEEAVGESQGLAIGVSLGKVVGESEISSVGVKLGKVVGESEGSIVGALEGSVVGLGIIFREQYSYSSQN